MRSAATKRGILALIAVLGCASAPRFAQMDADQLLTYGLDRLAAGKWNDATRVLEQFIFQYPAHDRYQEARYRLGEAHFGKKEYILAAAEFTRLADDFPAGSWADESRFRVCESYYRLSPKAQLDQEYTVAAIDHCRAVIAYFPDTEFAASARTMITELEHKLAFKLFFVAEHYFRRSAFDSAILCYEKVLAGYPSSPAAPRALLGLFRSYTEIGWEAEARQSRERLLRDFPDSEEARRLKSGSTAPPA
jgi:outer membrane protein assembly factor BamD